MYEIAPIDKENQLKIWKTKFEENSLTQLDFATFIQCKAPDFLHVNQQPNSDLGGYTYDEQAAQENVVELLETIICGENSQTFWDRIKLDDNATVCGKVFKIGEPTYSCRECTMDTTHLSLNLVTIARFLVGLYGKDVQQNI
ncbi:E3 ubiquitin-protein ligase UBR1-like [Uranotaenia lowii]|uniref:E3 ubiquitin-protein ligase UBR1-like n=1 Tax=Uranotaenia lowii TaxID=190385 RepID=UPI00247A9E57|nr:E3 ubiquitin-protein ligase UBR1-like [Uranotaenia lowii]